MPSMYLAVVRCGHSEWLDLVLEKAECFYVGKVLPVGWIHLVCVRRVPLHHRDCQCEKTQDVEKSEESETPEGFLQETHLLQLNDQSLASGSQMYQH